MAWINYGRAAGEELPDNIIYFRDGVSTGHYDKVKDVEHRAIRDAYDEARILANLKLKQLNLTSVILTKRHHTRFYPQKANEGDK
jgi:eukaryotic translation initiation factor 2C